MVEVLPDSCARTVAGISMVMSPSVSATEDVNWMRLPPSSSTGSALAREPATTAAVFSGAKTSTQSPVKPCWAPSVCRPAAPSKSSDATDAGGLATLVSRSAADFRRSLVCTHQAAAPAAAARVTTTMVKDRKRLRLRRRFRSVSPRTSGAAVAASALFAAVSAAARVETTGPTRSARRPPRPPSFAAGRDASAAKPGSRRSAAGDCAWA
ncbi:hypothetical protein D9M70_528320 [compost metagenome]